MGLGGKCLSWTKGGSVVVGRDDVIVYVVE